MKEEVYRRATVLLTAIAIVAVFAMLLAIKRHLLIASATHLHHKHNSVAHNKREDEVLKWLWRHHTPYMELETIFRNVPPKGFRFESKLDTLALKGKKHKQISRFSDQNEKSTKTLKTQHYLALNRKKELVRAFFTMTNHNRRPYSNKPIKNREKVIAACVKRGKPTLVMIGKGN